MVDGGPTTNPSTAEVLAAIRATGAGRVVLLPNDPNVHAVAAAAAEEARATGIRVGVVPTRSPVQALAAIAVRDPRRRFDDDVIAMAEAAGACRYAEVTVATREALTVAGRCQPGDVLALVEGEVNLIGADLRGDLRPPCSTGCSAGGGELVTLVLGRGRAGRAGRAADRAPGAGAGRSSRCRSTTAASRTTRCWWASNDHTGHTAGQGGRRRAKTGQGARRGASACTPSATCSTTSRAGTTSAASSPTSPAWCVGEEVTDRGPGAARARPAHDAQPRRVRSLEVDGRRRLRRARCS